jgi:hypothetical protein
LKTRLDNYSLKSVFWCLKSEKCFEKACHTGPKYLNILDESVLVMRSKDQLLHEYVRSGKRKANDNVAQDKKI